MPDYADVTPVYVQIADDLRELIRAGTYDSDDGKIPSNKDLTAKYKVADGTIRSALELLRDEGFVETRSTRGTYVADKQATQARPDLAAIGKRMTDLAERLAQVEHQSGLTEELRARLGKIEADVLYLFERFAIDDDHGGQHDGTEEAPRRGRAGR